MAMVEAVRLAGAGGLHESGLAVAGRNLAGDGVGVGEGVFFSARGDTAPDVRVVTSGGRSIPVHSSVLVSRRRRRRRLPLCRFSSISPFPDDDKEGGEMEGRGGSRLEICLYSGSLDSDSSLPCSLAVVA